MNSTRIAVSNSGPLIHLAKVGLLDFLFKVYNIEELESVKEDEHTNL